MPDLIIKYEADKEDLRQRITAATEDEKTFITEIAHIKAAVADDEVQRNAESLQIVRAKYNLKEFLSDASKIENVIKKLTSDELTIFNTSFPAYKKKYLETYGFNNRNMSVDEIVGFIQTGLTAPTAAAQFQPEPQLKLNIHLLK